jgi:uncharacterized FlaG/YvyC family protein
MMPEGKMTINQVSKVGQIDFGAGPVQVEAPTPAESPVQVESAQKEKPAAQKTEPGGAAPVLNGDVRLKFIVDSKTNDVTVLVLDKASRQVIRTIPSDELQNLTRGDLVTIFA